MDIEVSERPDGVQHVRLSGRLDTRGVDLVEIRFSAVVAEQGRRSIVDLGALEFAASMAIRMFLVTARAASRNGAKMALFGAQPAVREVFDYSGIGALVSLADDEAGALTHVAA